MKRFEVFHPNWDWKVFLADSPKEAALQAAEYYDRDDYTLAKGEEAGFTVREEGCHSLAYFRAVAHTSIHYEAQAIAHDGLDQFEARALEEALQSEREFEVEFRRMDE